MLHKGHRQNLAISNNSSERERRVLPDLKLRRGGMVDGAMQITFRIVHTPRPVADSFAEARELVLAQFSVKVSDVSGQPLARIFHK